LATYLWPWRGKGYSYDNQIEYNESLNYFRLKKFKNILLPALIKEVIDETEGLIDLLPESLINEYDTY
jgi:hypothetical protein